jgi:succinate dehydrogenase/fumarate reductase cytochrome b subunit
MNIQDLSSLGAALFWLVPFVLGERLRFGVFADRSGFLSCAAGIAIAYVFMDLLPQMDHMQRSFAAAAEGRGLPAPEFRVHGAALVGFLVFFSIHHFVFSTKARPDGTESAWPHRIDVLSYFAYCGLMSFLLVKSANRNLVSHGLYTIAMFFHFMVVDHSLRREHGERYNRAGRWIVIGGILVGWVVGTVGFWSDLIVPTLLGLIAGGVVINSLRSELPEKGEGRAVPFVLGALGYSALLLAIEVAAK